MSYDLKLKQPRPFHTAAIDICYILGKISACNELRGLIKLTCNIVTYLHNYTCNLKICIRY